MPAPVNLIRPDGTTISVPESVAASLRKIGYRDESTDEAQAAAVDAGESAYYSSPGQRVLAAGEGVASGASLGLLDPVMADEATRGRARANPGTRLAGEVLGMVGPALLSGGSSLAGEAAAVAPSALIGRVGAAGAELLGGGVVRRAAVRTAIEGAGFGAGGAVTRATLSGDPVTAEAVVDGAGWGAIYGAGLGGATAALGRGATRLAGRIAAGDAEAAAVSAARSAPVVTAEGLVGEGAYDGLHAAVQDFTGRATRMDEELAAARAKAAPGAAPSPASPAPQPAGAASAERKTADLQARGKAEAPAPAPDRTPVAGEDPAQDLGEHVLGVTPEAADLAGGRLDQVASLPPERLAALQRASHVLADARDFQRAGSAALGDAVLSGAKVRSGVDFEAIRQELKTAQGQLERRVAAAVAPGADPAAWDAVEEIQRAYGDSVRGLVQHAGSRVRVPAWGDSAAAFEIQGGIHGSARAARLFREGEAAAAAGETAAVAPAAEAAVPAGEAAVADPFATQNIRATPAPAAEADPLATQNIRGAAPAAEAVVDPAATASLRGAAPAAPAGEVYDIGLSTEELARRADAAAAARGGGLTPEFARQIAEAQAAAGGAAAVAREVTPLEDAVLAKAGEEAGKIRAAADHLRSFPRSAREFFRMSDARAERMFGALEHALGTTSPELATLRGSLEAAARGIAEGMQVTAHAGGGAVADLRAAWSTGREALAQEATRAAVAARGDHGGGGGRRPGVLERVISSGVRHGAGRWGAKAVGGVGAPLLPAIAYQAAATLGHGAAGGIMGLGLAAEVSGFRAAATDRIQRAVAAWVPGATRAVARGVAQVEPLSRRLDGTVDPTARTRREHAVERSREIRAAAPSVRDTLYRAVAELHAAGHADFARAVHAAGVGAFDALVAALPRDPGTARTARGSLWRPSEAQAATISRVYQIFHDGPTAVLEQWVTSDRVPHPDEVAMVAQSAPALYGEMRGAILHWLADPIRSAQMSVHDQRRAGAILQRDVHSVTSAPFVLAQQEMFRQRPEAGPPSSPAPAAPAPGGAYHPAVLPAGVQMAPPPTSMPQPGPGAGATPPQISEQR